MLILKCASILEIHACKWQIVVVIHCKEQPMLKKLHFVVKFKDLLLLMLNAPINQGRQHVRLQRGVQLIRFQGSLLLLVWVVVIL